MSSSTNNKKRAKKGKALSEQLREKDARKAAELAEIEADREAVGRGAEGSSDAEAADAAGASSPDGGAASDEGEDADDEGADDEDDSDERDEAADDEDGSEGADAGDADSDEDEPVAAAIGYQRYVLLSFVTLALIAGYVVSRALTEAWSEAASWPKFVQAMPQFSAVPHEGELVSRMTISTVLGLVIGGAIVLHYYRRPDVRTWADEVADEISKVKWPTRKEIGNYTVIVIAGSALLTAYLTLLDRFWAFVTNLIYSTGA